jgi:hypothetical protein
VLLLLPLLLLIIQIKAEQEKEAHAEAAAADAHIRRDQPDDARKNAPAKRQIDNNKFRRI